MKTEKCNRMVRIMLCGLLCVMAICLLLLVYAFIEEWLFGGRKLWLCREGIENFIGICKIYHPLFVALFSCATLFIATLTLQRRNQLEAVKCLVELREKFNSPEKKEIHYMLLPEEDRDPLIIPELERNAKDAEKPSGMMKYSNVEVFDYLGTMELGYIMLEKGLIDYDDFKNQFGYRFENCRNHCGIRKHIEDNKSYYTKLCDAFALIDNKNSKSRRG